MNKELKCYDLVYVPNDLGGLCETWEKDCLAVIVELEPRADDQCALQLQSSGYGAWYPTKPLIFLGSDRTDLIRKWDKERDIREKGDKLLRLEETRVALEIVSENLCKAEHRTPVSKHKFIKPNDQRDYRLLEEVWENKEANKDFLKIHKINLTENEERIINLPDTDFIVISDESGLTPGTLIVSGKDSDDVFARVITHGLVPASVINGLIMSMYL